MEVQKRIKGVNLLFLAIVLVMIVYEIAASFLKDRGIDITFGSTALTLVYSQLILALPALIYLIFVRKSFKVLRFKKIKFTNILLCILIYICITPILNFFNALSMFYSTNVISDVMFNISDEVPFLLGLFLIAILPCFLEEMVYRGVFYNTYREAAGFGAAFLCGLLFGLVHGNLNQFTYAFILGVVFALIVEATDSLWSTVICHALVNAFSVCYIYALPGILRWVQGIYDAAKAEGDTNTMNLLKNFFGGENFTVEAIMGSVDDAVLTNEQIFGALLHYLFPAILGGVFVFLLLRHIARGNGRWEIMCNMFRKRSAQVSQSAETKTVETQNAVAALGETESGSVPDYFRSEQMTETTEAALTPKPQKRIRLVTWALVAGMVIMCLLMVKSNGKFFIRFRIEKVEKS